MPVTKAATGRMMANPSPISEKVAKMESMPVCGVAIRNEATAPLEAPSFFSPMAVGITPHEHNGNGIPNNAAYTTDIRLFCDKYLW